MGAAQERPDEAGEKQSAEADTGSAGRGSDTGAETGAGTGAGTDRCAEDAGAPEARTAEGRGTPDDGASGTGVPLRVEGFGVRGPRGWAFRGVGFDAAPGSLVALEGPSGTGRTALLLALTGRMRAHEGHAEVGHHRLPRQAGAVRRISALAHVTGVTDLEPSLTVGEHLRERVLLERRFGSSPAVGVRALLRPRAERTAEVRSRIADAAAAVGLDLAALPKGPRTAVRDLERTEALRLSLALALIGRPRLLGVDDTDLKLAGTERAEVWALLRSLADAGTTVLAVCSEAPEGTLVVPTASRTATTGPAAAERTPADTLPADTPPAATTGDPADDHPADDPATGTTAGTTAGTPPTDDEETADALAEARRA